MASRRNRIKGIANIPQRRKPNATNSEEIHVESSPKIGPEPPEKQPNLASINDKNTSDSQLLADNSLKKTLVENGHAVKKTDEQAESNTSSEINDISKPAVSRRRFIKPTIITHLINRQSKPTTKVTNEKSAKPEVVVCNESTNDVSTKSTSPKPASSTVSETQKKIVTDVIQIKSPEQINLTLNETAIVPGNLSDPQRQDEINGSYQTNILGIRKIPTNFAADTKSGSDTEYSGASYSPNKVINRSRIKAVPRFGQRRTSYSASESEDDSRRIGNRNRNDSVCSTASGVQEQQNVGDAGVPQKKEFSSVIQRKCKRTEQSRKLAEARREFQLKFGDTKPDKQKLTMIDLIFYNPTTNPMSQKKKHNLSISENNENPLENEPLEETIDDPVQSDEENELPAPQIKIGSSGEIIVDEKSLVIENKEIKKNREELQKSAVIDGDFDTSYGIYKRVKRSKDWSQAETLNFYKALNTIGTDFTLMCELFPQRSRRELKMKFKKEEKMNRALVDRAVMQPKSFDLAVLKHEIELEEREIEMQKKINKEGEQKCKTPKRPKRKSVFATDCEIDAPSPSDRITRQKSGQLRNSNSTNVDLCRGIECVLDNEPAELNSHNKFGVDNDDDSDYTLDDKLEDSKRKRTKKSLKPKKKLKVSTEDDEQKKLEPGSIMILSTKSTKGESVYKVYMVTPGQENEPVNVANITETTPNANNNDNVLNHNITNIITISEDENDNEMPEENNVTIPAEQGSNAAPVTESDNKQVNKTAILLGENASDHKIVNIDKAKDCVPLISNKCIIEYEGDDNIVLPTNL